MRNRSFYAQCMLAVLIVANVLYTGNVSAQPVHLLPPGQPEQDACNALVLCGNRFVTPYSYSGAGHKLDLASTPCFPSTGGGEINSVWFRININAPGKLAFKIIPVDSLDDYDFAVLDITKKSCTYVFSSDVVRCNFAGDAPGYAGITGLDDSATLPFITQGNPFSAPVDAKAGDIYLIMVNNYGSDSLGDNKGSAGFTLDFTGSTALFNNNTQLSFSNVDMPCSNATSITLSLTTPVLCSSIAKYGSDFAINAPVSITGADGINCTGDSGYTSAIVINFSSALPAGNYTLHAQNGTDGNTLLNLCNNALSLQDAIAFTILTSGKQVTVNQTICSKQLPYVWNGITVTGGGDHAAEYITTSAEGCDSTTILNLTVLSSSVESVTVDQFICYEHLPYLWNGITVTKGGEQVAEYTTASAAGCDSTTILNLYVGDPPVQTSSTKAICAYSSYTLPWDSTVTSAGTYTHHYINAAGCDSLIEQITLIDSACKDYVYIPTAFTPNTDKKNDIFKPVVLGNVTNYRFTIYNRWGKEIFSSTDVLKGWDGAVNGFQQPQGTYVWVCSFQLPNQSLQIQRGTVVLLR